MSSMRLYSLCAIAGLAACAENRAYEMQIKNADPEQGRIAMRTYQCGVCHVIPGVRGARGRVGPPLEAYARHVYVAGKFPNRPDVLIQWLRDAPSMAPETAMPAIAMTEVQARDMAAYLYSLD